MSNLISALTIAAVSFSFFLGKDIAKSVARFIGKCPNKSSKIKLTKCLFDEPALYQLL